MLKPYSFQTLKWKLNLLSIRLQHLVFSVLSSPSRCYKSTYNSLNKLSLAQSTVLCSTLSYVVHRPKLVNPSALQETEPEDIKQAPWQGVSTVTSKMSEFYQEIFILFIALHRISWILSRRAILNQQDKPNQTSPSCPESAVSSSQCAMTTIQIWRNLCSPAKVGPCHVVKPADSRANSLTHWLQPGTGSWDENQRYSMLKVHICWLKIKNSGQGQRGRR